MTARASIGLRRPRILVHQVRQQLLIERAPVDADAHRLVVLQRQLDDGRELPVLLVLEADVARIDAVLVERLGAGRVLRQQLVADVVEVADDAARSRRACASASRMCGTALAASSRSTVMRTSSEPARCQRRDLRRRSGDVGRIGVGHRLHDDGRVAADDHAAHVHCDRAPACCCLSSSSCALQSALSAPICGPSRRQGGRAV